MLKAIKINFVILLISFHLAGYADDPKEFTPIEDRAKIPILTPSLANRQSEKIRLNNGLEAYIISDPRADSSSAVITVKTGSWEDPEGYPGTAHFLEHMLFLGTKKYPKESDYDRYIAEHGGQSNAFTNNEHTSYAFTVDNKAFPGALDRFASFFKEPLFNPSGVSRELQAIDQEYAQNLEDDDIREYYVLKTLAHPSHPLHAFGMGNSLSLKKVSQEVLKAWYDTHYSANRMRLAVTSNLPMDQLRALVVEDFKDIPNKDILPFDIKTPMFPDSLKEHIIYIEPLKNVRKLTLVWELPPKFAGMRETKPEDIVCYVLGHEGEKSLLSNLKKSKYADSLNCASDIYGGSNSILALEIDLTDAGVRNVDTVILRCFEALADFRKTGPLQYLFDDLHKVSIIDYEYQPKEDSLDYLLKEAIWLGREDMSTFPEQSQVINKFDPAATQDLINFLTPQNCIITVMAPKNLTGVTTDRKEQWLDVSYSVLPVPKETLQEWEGAKPNPDIELPAPNLLIPEKLTIVNSMVAATTNPEYAPIPHPNHILDSESGSVFFAPDTFFAVPEISWTFEIKTPSIQYSSVESTVLGDLYVKYVEEALNPYSYPASMAGLDFDITLTENGFELSIEGYNDKAELLFTDIIDTIKELHPREQQFKLYKEILIRDYQNSLLDKPFYQVFDILKNILYKDYPTNQAKLQAIRKITFDQFEAFCESLFNKTYVEGMLYGNMSEAEAKQISNLLLDTLGSKPYPKSEQLKKAVLMFPKDKGPYYLEYKTKTQGNAALLVIQCEPFSFKNRAAQQILMQGMREPFFTSLRTIQQTGYIVTNQPQEVERHLFDIFAVQSNTHEGRDLIARFELFIEGFMQEIAKSEITLERFNTIKNALLKDLRQPAKNISEMGALLTKLAFDYEADFNWMDKRIAGFTDLTYEEFLELSRNCMSKNNKQRLGIILTGSIPYETTLQYKKINNLAQLRKLSQYKEQEKK